MRSGLVGCLAAMLLAMGAIPTMAAKPAAGCGADISVNTIVRGTALAPEPGSLEFISDGNESYPNGGGGSNKIVGRFQVDNCTHDFTLNLNQSSRYMVGRLDENFDLPGVITSKFFNFDRVASVPITTGAESPAWCAEGVVFGTDGKIRKNADGTYQDNYAGCGQDADGSWYVLRAAVLTFYEGPTRDYYLYFRASPLDGAGSFCANRPELCAEGVPFVRVYHPAAKTWILRPYADSLSLGAALSQNGTGGGFRGYETVPFEIVVTRP